MDFVPANLGNITKTRDLTDSFLYLQVSIMFSDIERINFDLRSLKNPQYGF
jgi:hypothetical protein